MEYKLFTPPVYAPNAVATNLGWVNPVTGELLVSVKDLKDRIEKFNNSVQRDPLYVEPKNDAALVPAIEVSITVEEPTEETPKEVVQESETVEESVVESAETVSEEKPKRRSTKRG